MALPKPGSHWPLPGMGRVLSVVNEHQAWYSGDPVALTNHYVGRSTGPKTRASQQAGGLVGAVSRWFWGRPVADGQQRISLHVPIAADIAAVNADILYSEPPTIAAPGGVDDKRLARLNEVLTANSIETLLPEMAEQCSALGGMYGRVTWDGSFAQHPLITFVHPSRAIPEWRWGRLAAVTFVNEAREGDRVVWRHLERHAPGVIEHALYQGSADNLGSLRALTDHDLTRSLATSVNEASQVTTGHAGLTAVYVPNMRPQRRLAGDPFGAHLGRADTDGLEPLMDALDETWTSLMRDMRLGKGRIHIDRDMVTDGEFNVDSEVYLLTDSMQGSEKIQNTQFAIRVNEHLAIAEGLLREILRGAGIGPQTVGLPDPSGASQTAAETHSRDARTAQTREKKTRYQQAGLTDLLEAVTAVDAFWFKQGAAFRPVVTLTDPPPSLLTLATSAQMLRAAEAASTETIVRTVFPGRDDTWVKAEVARILSERGANVDGLTFVE